MFSRPLFLQRRTAIFAVSAAGLACAFAAGKSASSDKKKEPAPPSATAPAEDSDADAAAGGNKTKPAAPEPSPQFRRAVGAMRAGDWKASRTAWETVLRAEPANAAALANFGKVLCQLQDYPAAQTVLEKATALKPSLSDSWLMLGQTWLARQSPMMAVSCMARGVAENPSDAGGHNSLAIALKQAGWTDAAEAELQKALDLNPAFGEAHFNLAVIYLERKPPSLEMGRRHYRRALELGAMADPVVAKQIQGESAITAPESDLPTDGESSTALSASTSGTSNKAGNRGEAPGKSGSASTATGPGPGAGSSADSTANSGDAPEKNASASGPGIIAPVPPAPAASPARKAGTVPGRSPSFSSPTPSPASSSPRSPFRKS